MGDEYSSVVAVCLGKADQGYSELEAVQEMRESIRTAMAGKTMVWVMSTVVWWQCV